MDINMESMMGNESKTSAFSKPYSSDGIMPVSLLMLGEILQKKERKLDGLSCTRVINICRIDYIQPRGMKWEITINDNTGFQKMIKFKDENEEELQKNCYYEVIINLKQENGDIILHCDRIRKISDVQQIIFHSLNVIQAHCSRTHKNQ